MSAKKNDLEFLEQSNAIEGVYDSESLARAWKAWKFALSRKKIAEPMILEVHRLLMGPGAGEWRKVGVRVGSHLAPEASRVPLLIKEWVREASVKPLDFMAVRDHHVWFERIHPFEDGNGRVGRILMNWQRVAQLRREPIVIREEERQEYYEWFRQPI
jgi:Fic family protein